MYNYVEVLRRSEGLIVLFICILFFVIKCILLNIEGIKF